MNQFVIVTYIIQSSTENYFIESNDLSFFTKPKKLKIII